MEGVVRAGVPPGSAPAEIALDDTEVGVRQYGQWGLVWRRFTRHRMAVAGSVLVLLMVALALLGPMISPGFIPFIQSLGGPPLWAHTQTNIAPQLWPPHWRFLLGTDASANPVISYVLEGGRPLLLIGFLGALIASVVGAIFGSLAGYIGGVVDAVLMRIVDAFLAVPFLLFLVLFSQQLTDRSPLIYAVMFGILGWPGIARLVRGYILSLREREFAEAARALGVSSWGVILRHLLPNALDILVVSFTLNIAIFIVIEVTLDYLGAGTGATTWGTPLSGAFAGLINDNWWVGTFPAIPIIIAALGFNFLGDGLRDALDASSPTALIVASSPVRRRKVGPVRRRVLAATHMLAMVWRGAATALSTGRRHARDAALAIPLPRPVRALGRTRQQYRATPLPMRVVPIVVVTLAMGIAMLYAHSPLVYSANYGTPATYASLYDAAEFGAVPATSTGGWDTLVLDSHERVAYQRIDAHGRVTIDRELMPGDDASRPSLAMHGNHGLGAWVGNGGATVYAARLGVHTSRPFSLNPSGGTVWNPDVVAASGGYLVLFGWQRPGTSTTDIYLAGVPDGSGSPSLVRIVRSGDYALYPRGVIDGSTALDVIYLRRFAPGQYTLNLQRFQLSGVPLSRPQSLGIMNYVIPGSNGCNVPDITAPNQWAIDMKRAADGSVWAAWATGVDCVTKGGISGANVMTIGHWSASGKVLLPSTPIDPGVDASGQTVALALQGHGGVAYYPQPGTVQSHLAATHFDAAGTASVPQRVNYEGGGDVANPRAGTIGGRPAVIWERAHAIGADLVGTMYHPHAPPDLLTHLGLNLGNLWANIALIVFGALAVGVAVALANVYLLAPLIVVWLLIHRFPPRLRWPLYLAAIALLFAWVFAIPATLPGYVLVMTTFGVPDAWLAVAGAVLVAGWSGRHFLARQESAMRATAMSLIALYFIAVMYAVMYLEGQIGKI